jgi:hypothetical protein
VPTATALFMTTLLTCWGTLGWVLVVHLVVSRQDRA